jgi:imidazolonepropionase-like amidohydrolase
MAPEDGEGAFYYTAASAKEIEEKWPAFLATKPDVVKVYLVYSEEFNRRRNDEKFFGRRGLDPALLPLLVAQARSAGLPVVAHVESAADFHVAVTSGVSVVNHMPGFWPSEEALGGLDFQRYRIDDRDARIAAKKRIAVVTTLSESLSRLREPQLKGAADLLLDLYRSNLAMLRKHKVRVLIGSDRFRETSQAEVTALVESGLMTPDEALRAWCEATPQAIFPDRKLGKIEDGYEANFVVLPADPVRDFSVLKDVRRRFKHGAEITFR